MKTTRNSRIELLRIFSTLTIIAYHCTRTFDDFLLDQLSPFNRFAKTVFGIWGALGVDLFIIISAWYLCNQEFKLKKLLGIIFEYVSYILIFCIVDVVSIKGSVLSIIKYFVGDIFYRFESLGGYWFVTAYILMYLISPLLNKLINYKSFSKALILLSFIPIYSNFYGRGGALCSFTMFVYIYLLTAYIKKINFRFRHPVILSLSITTLLIVLNYLIAYININDFIKHELYLTIGNCDNGSLIILFLSYLIFLNSVDKKPYTNRVINFIASFSLGIYCFHESLRYNILNKIITYFCVNSLINNDNFVCQYILIVLFVFTLGIFIETIRKFILQKPFDNIVRKNKQIEKINEWINSI